MGHETPKVLVVDDDMRLRALLERYLVEQGFVVRSAANSEQMDRLLERENFHLLVLDLMLPGEDGLSICRRLRQNSNDIPIVMLTAKGDEVDRIIGLELGADDYMPKPFNPRELVARIRAVLRRYGHGSTKPNLATGQGIAFRDMRIDVQSRQLLDAEGEEVPLTNAEYRLLEYFARNPDRVIPRPELLKELGSDMERYVDRTIDVLILRLRRKIEPVPSKPVHLQTRRAQGYIFNLGTDVV